MFQATQLKTEDELKQGLELLKDRNRIRFVLGRHDYNDFEHTDLVIQNPGVPPDSPYIARARERGIQVETDISIFLELVKDKAAVVVGVTGTKGKSTTTSLIHAILSLQGHALLAGNITVSVFDILEEVRHNSHIVLELSSFQLGGLKHKGFSPPVAVMTNLLDDHLNYYASREAYFEDKRVIHAFQHEGDYLVLNRENQVYDVTEENRGVNRVSFGLGEDFTGDGSYLHEGNIQYRRAGSHIPVMGTEHIQIRGRHNIYNALAAAATAMAMGVKPGVVKEGIEGFPGLPHRLEPVQSRGGLRFVNDSAATTPDAAAEGIFSIDGSLTLIAGGSDKGLELCALTEAINRRVSLLVLLEGNGTRRLLSEKIDVPYTVCGALPEAVEYACTHSTPPATILLSPGFASFGMFRNEFDRGDQFRELVVSRYGNTAG